MPTKNRFFTAEGRATRHYKLLKSSRSDISKAINDNEEITDELFQEVVRTLLDDLQTPMKLLQEDLGVTRATITRWREGEAMPIRLARKAVVLYYQEVCNKLIADIESEVQQHSTE